MAPKPSLKDAKSQIPRLVSSYRKPVTTKEKLDAIAAKAKKPVKARSPPPDSDPNVEPEPKKRKMKYMPPPDELPSANPQVKLGKVMNSRRKAAVTTQEKIVEAENKKRINARREKDKKKAEKAAELAKKKAEDQQRGQTGNNAPVKGEKTAIPKDPSAYDLLEKQASPSVIQYTGIKKARGKGVLFRPTARAVMEKSAITNKAEIVKRANKTPAAPTFKDVFKPGKKEDVFRLMDLPKEIRNRIWKLVVVHHPYCVWPAGQKHGREQPDLCMTSKELRGEVLPVFYGQNFFAVDITPLRKAPEAKKLEAGAKDDHVAEGDIGTISKLDEEGQASEETNKTASKEPASESVPKPTKAPNEVNGVAQIQPWAVALESGDHLSKIQHWVLSSTPEVITPGKRFPVLDEENSLIVYLHLRREAIDDTESGQDDQDNTAWRASVEVHRESRCVVPRNEEYQRCIVQMTPDWLNGMVDLALRKTDQDGTVTTETMLGLARVLRSKVDELVDHRCQPMV